MSGGRVELGLGAGWYEAEHEAYAIPFPSLGERFERLEEQLAIVSGLWANPIGERFSFTGRHYEVKDSPGLPKPVQQPGPPIIVGGHGPTRTPRLAARYATEFNLAFSSARGVRRAVRPRPRRVRGHRPRPVLARLLRRARPVLRGGRGRVPHGARPPSAAQPDELREHGAAGLVPEVAATLDRWRQAGAERLYLQVLDLSDLEHLELVAAEVASQLP